LAGKLHSIGAKLVENLPATHLKAVARVARGRGAHQSGCGSARALLHQHYRRLLRAHLRRHGARRSRRTGFGTWTV